VSRDISPETLVGSWTHSHEDDHEGRQVFRPADGDFPPSRGRTTFTLLPDQLALVGTPGPDDRGTTTDGTWSLDGDVLRIALPHGDATYQVLAADADHLELRLLV
jgi:hypothetical protein